MGGGNYNWIYANDYQNDTAKKSGRATVHRKKEKMIFDKVKYN